MERVAVHLPCICPASPLHLRTSPSHRLPTRGHHTAQIKATARRQGKAFTVGGRMRPLPHIASTNPDQQTKAERQAASQSYVSPVICRISPSYLHHISLTSPRISQDLPMPALHLPTPPTTHQVVNSTIQGSAADVMKEATPT